MMMMIIMMRRSSLCWENIVLHFSNDLKSTSKHTSELLVISPSPLFHRTDWHVEYPKDRMWMCGRLINHHTHSKDATISGKTEGPGNTEDAINKGMDKHYNQSIVIHVSCVMGVMDGACRNRWEEWWWVNDVDGTCTHLMASHDGHRCSMIRWHAHESFLCRLIDDADGNGRRKDVGAALTCWFMCLTHDDRLHKPENVRNVAVIAHIDHGKTTLVDKVGRSLPG